MPENYYEQYSNREIFGMSPVLLSMRTASIPSGHSTLSLITFKPFLYNRRYLADHEFAPAKDTSDTKNGISEKPRIMIVDDEKDVTMIFKLALERASFQVEVFNDPIQALTHFEPEYCDLLILDVRMPTLPGFELFSELKKKDKNVKACFVSAFEVYKEETTIYLPNTGQDSTIVRKPISTRDLVRLVKEKLSGN
jgi:CheY-like chemotaxis protein